MRYCLQYYTKNTTKSIFGGIFFNNYINLYFLINWETSMFPFLSVSFNK